MNKLILIFLLCGSFLNGVAQRDSLSADEAVITANIEVLSSEDSKIREAAAKELRRIIAKYSSGTSNIRDKDGGEASWMAKTAKVVPGMLKTEVVKILPPFPESSDASGIGSGQTHTAYYRLDNVWMVRIAYSNSDVLLKIPELIKRHREFYVEPPKNFTGTWTSWHVNGQKAHEIQFVNRKYNGTLTKFHDNGQKAYEQNYVDHVGEGPDTGWFTDGKIRYTGQYKNAKQDGQWLHLYPDGRKSSESNFNEGVRDGLHAQWYENGQMRFEMNYRNGIKHGTDAAWSEQGLVHYKREYVNGKVVE